MHLGFLLKAIPSVLAHIADMGASSNWPEFWSFKLHIFPNFSTLMSWMIPLTMGIRETGIQGHTERGWGPWIIGSEETHSLSVELTDIDSVTDLNIPPGHWTVGGSLVWGWSWTPSYNKKRALQTLIGYYVLWDPIISEHMLNNGLAVSITVGRPFRGTSFQALEKQSTATRTVVGEVWELGRLVMKSTTIWDHRWCGMRRGLIRPTANCLLNIISDVYCQRGPPKGILDEPRGSMNA